MYKIYTKNFFKLTVGTIKILTVIRGFWAFLFILTYLSVQSCGVKHKSITETLINDGQSYSWRLEIKFDQNDRGAYGILALLANNAQTVSLAQATHLSKSTQPGTIVFYVTATNDQVNYLRQSLLDVGALAVIVYKANTD